MHSFNRQAIKKTATCDICHFTTDYADDVVFYGDWMEKQSVKVHYFCLLLSTDLPQRGTDKSGILGFLIRDIRKEIRAAAGRNCCFCSKPHASIACVTCRKFFHLSCGLDTHECVFRFSGDFSSYCDKCAPTDDYQRQILEKPPQNVPCSVCMKNMPVVLLSRVVYCNCCRKSFAHRVCLKRYALSAGYYLRCIWCRSAEFRDWVRLQGVFVPDREASWEVDKNAFSDHYRGHMRCDIDPCLCPKGRDYQRAAWIVLRCKLCASFGAHVKCAKLGIKDKVSAKDYKCSTCRETEDKLQTNGDFNSSIYCVKQRTENSTNSPNCEGSLSDETSVSSTSVVTVIEAPRKAQRAVRSPVKVSSEFPINVDDIKIVESNEQPSKQANDLEQRATAADVSIKNDDKKPIFPRPLQIKRSYNYSKQPDYFFLEIYEMDASQNNCIGTIVLRFSITDSRLQNKSIAALERLAVTEADVHERNSDRGIYARLDQIMKEELQKLNIK